jgi:histidinol-phosphate/aromatic aminotransferase/cobyric acid decarboxylase-like protein
MPGVKVYPSRANFLLIELDHAGPKAVFEALYARGILVRDVTSYPRLSRCLRVSVGSEAENRLFLEVLSEALAAQPAALEGRP